MWTVVDMATSSQREAHGDGLGCEDSENDLLGVFLVCPWI